MSIVPILIRPHLVPFFFKESEGREYLYGNKKVKPVIFTSTASSMGRMIRLLMVKAGKPLNVSNFNLTLSITDDGNGKKYKGEFYKYENGRNSFLKLPPEVNEDINDLLEDLFRMSFVSYMNGYIEFNPDAAITTGIDKFIDKYDLLEFGFSNDTLRQLYYREKKNGKLIARFQTKKSAKILNYIPV